MTRRRSSDPEETLRRRTRVMIDHHRRRAMRAGAEIDYDLGRLREMVRGEIPSCPYCLGELTASNFSADHAEPVCRGGSFLAANLVICCQSCNTAKGPLNAGEWADLLGLMAFWPAEIRRNTLARLKAGAPRARMKVR